MPDLFSGKLTLNDGEVVRVDLGIDDALTLSTDGTLIGSWPIKYCRVSRTTQSSFLLSIDGEKVVFAPDHAHEFGRAAAQRFHASSLADRIGVIREVPTTADSPEEEEEARGAKRHLEKKQPRDLARFGRLGLGVVAMLILVGIVMALLDRVGEIESTPTSTLLAADVTVDATPAVALFDQNPTQFVETWNVTAASLGAPIQIRGSLTAGSFEAQLAPFLTLQGTTDRDGTIASLVLVADPNGDTADDRLALAAWGVAIAVADPNLGTAGRRDVLDRLGLDVDAPELDGLDGEIEGDGVRYTLQYFPEFSSVLFSLAER